MVFGCFVVGVGIGFCRVCFGVGVGWGSCFYFDDIDIVVDFIGLIGFGCILSDIFGWGVSVVGCF